MSMCAQSTPGSTKCLRKAAAWHEDPSGFPEELVRSAVLGFTNSSWYSSTGICQVHSSICLPTSPISFANYWLLVKTPALCLPKATTIAPVKVESSTKVFTLQFVWTQFMQSARTSRPSASVFPISTVSPFLDLMMSSGLQLFELTKFSASPRTATTLHFRLSLATLSKALSTEQAPCLSMCMPEIPPVGLRLSPPESKQSPFPTKATQS